MKAETEAWIEVAAVDFRTAELVLSADDPIPESAFYHAQQCIEKYLKAVLEAAGQPVPRTHDLGTLLTLTVGFVPALAAHRADIEEVARMPSGSAIRTTLRCLLTWTQKRRKQSGSCGQSAVSSDLNSAARNRLARRPCDSGAVGDLAGMAHPNRAGRRIPA
jgi:hypothetical protein